ncbi:helix-turn-helix transcriptional regulator [Nocardia cyriacigeorgica]|uniref:Helix-turn-helix transcriptional regulator n=1 Tax=Nocardia cyriacigeorgica TaxID=135487 RepID=A0A6P1D984_9NOCA|nr:AraC family transcriptional regulator [Nocardia cyriacigeorgica]NEW42126.1 helix-turn-helix transcriptional regulator [Nocardia cyriacigeorgica]NEW44832.1 helix-turn-helix transcriptional regulator [Nocardia cyriacigeorgica]NEW53068.1 helix-turn-helix transcriptional regulator [Nocardia cyriacigeorgica]NEW57113.1 helix-turn-helix transcriptional regulator [Nocardia cyriacigeorgica]
MGTLAQVDAGRGGLEDVLAGLQWRFAGRDVFTLAAGQLVYPGGESSALVVTEGLVRVEGLGDADDLTHGDFLFVPCARRYAVNALSEATVLCVRLAPVGSGSAMDALPSRVLLTDFVQHAPLAATMMQHLVEQCPDPEGVQGDRVATLMASMAIESWHARGCAPKRWLLRVNEPGVARAVAAMHADPGQEWTVEALARVALASRSGFAARFQAATGLTPGRYLTRLRIERAQRFLIEQDAAIGTVARRLGYSSETAFGRAFRRHTGHTPSEWRRAARVPTV